MFKPNLNPYSGQGAFRHWVQKVLPAVYDDSLSYYELLCKLVAVVNTAIEDVATAEANIALINSAFGAHEAQINNTVTAFTAETSAAITAFKNLINSEVDEFESQISDTVTDLQDFVNNYFDNLDVQEEINNKLDDMATSGALSALLAPLIPDVITDWLEAHITPTTPPVDDTLNVSGAAADAEVTGDAIYANKNRDNNTPFALTWWDIADLYTSENKATPNDIPVNTMCYCSGNLLDGFAPAGKTLTSGYYYLICLNPVPVDSTVRKYAIFSGNGTTYYQGSSTDSGVNVNWRDFSHYSTDDTLQIEGRSADAKTVGDIFSRINNEIGNLIHVDSSNSRTITLPISVSAGDIYYIIPIQTSDYVPTKFNVYGYTASPETVVSDTYREGKMYVCHFRKNYSNIRIGYTISPAPTSSFTKKILICKKANYSTINMLSKSHANRKYISILGASTSTYEGTIPNGYSCYYPYRGQAYDGTTLTCVNNLHDMYWQKTIDALDLQLLVNNSASGSFLTTGHNQDSLAGCGNRAEALDKNGINPDIIVVQMGMNDYNYEVPLGIYDGTNVAVLDTQNFREAYALMLDKMMKKYPNATIICCTIPNHHDNFSYNGLIEINDSGLTIKTYNDSIKDIANLFGAKVCDLFLCGITFQNLKEYCQDYNNTSKYGMHANIYGHTLMANELIKTIDSSNNTLYNVYK